MRNILCFGDSNTWGYIPETKERFPRGVRWTSILQEKLQYVNVNILEEGLCGRTTMFDDQTRPDRNGFESLPEIFEKYDTVDEAVIMLGTNDCKSYFGNSAHKIAEGVDRCLDEILKHVPAENVLLISPIHLGEKVWMKQYDPEFDKNSVVVSMHLKEEYERIANSRGVRFIAASDYVSPSEADQEHLTAQGHRDLANVLFEELAKKESVLKKISA